MLKSKLPRIKPFTTVEAVAASIIKFLIGRESKVQRKFTELKKWKCDQNSKLSDNSDIHRLELNKICAHKTNLRDLYSNILKFSSKENRNICPELRI